MREAAEDEEAAAAAEAATPDGLFADVKFTFLIKESAAEKGKAKRCTLCPSAVQQKCTKCQCQVSTCAAVVVVVNRRRTSCRVSVRVHETKSMCVCVVHLTLRVVGHNQAK